MLVYTIFAIIAVVISTSQASDLTDKGKFAALRDGCLKTAGIANDQIDTARQGTYTQNPAVSAYFKCTFTKLGFLNDAGAFNIDALVTKFPASADSNKVRSAGEACGKENTHKDDDAAQWIYTCFVQKFGPVSFA